MKIRIEIVWDIPFLLAIIIYWEYVGRSYTLHVLFLKGGSL